MLKLFNLNNERIEYIRAKKLDKVFLEGRGDEIFMILAEIGDDGYLVKCFCLKDDIDEDPDVPIPDDFTVICKDRDEVKREADIYFSKFMSKYFKIN